MKIVNKDIITKVISDVLNNLNITLGYSKNQLFIKCNENSATRRGKGAVVTLAKSKNLKNIPLRHLQGSE